MAVEEIIKPYKNRITYPNKFLDLGSTYFPVNVKELISLCRVFYYSSPILRNIVNKLSEYPISDMIMRVDENVDNIEAVKNKYTELFDVHLRLKTILLETGINYNVNGSIIITLNQDFRRQLICNSCKESSDGETVEKLKIRRIQKKVIVQGVCPKCKSASSVFTIADIPKDGPESINIIFWNPMELDIEYNEWTGKKRFIYNIPDNIKNRILTANGDKDKYFILTVPKIYIDAVEKDKSIELDAFHFGTPELAQDKRGFNIPVVVSVLKDMWYYITARRAQEAIFGEHVVPFRSVFPSAIPGVDPFTMMRLDKWKSTAVDQINKWKQDPNHIMVSPIPLGSQSVGGDAKYLLMTNELRLIEEGIINGFGAPLELIKGGVSWSGSAISLRILENHFLNFRTDLERMMNTFIIPKVAKMLNLPIVKVRFSRLRMGDDQQFKQTLLQMVQLGFLSLETLHEEYGFDPLFEKNRITVEQKWFNDVKFIQGKGVAQVQADQQVILSRAQIQAQAAAMQEQAKIQLQQQNAYDGTSSSPQVQDLANQFLNLPDSKSRKEFLTQLAAQPNGKETVAQLTSYLQAYAEQNLQEQEPAEVKDNPNGKIDAGPTGKARKQEYTEDRVKASKKTNK